MSVYQAFGDLAGFLILFFLVAVHEIGRNLLMLRRRRETTLCLATAHALVQLDDGAIVGDPMEKTTLEALDWKLSKGAHVSLIHVMLIKSCTAGDTIAPTSAAAQHRTQLVMRRRFQFSSALKCMSTISSLPGGKTGTVAFSGATDFMPELNRWLQIVEMQTSVCSLLCSFLAC